MKTVKDLLLLFVSWRVITLIISILSVGTSSLWVAATNFDGVRYLNIAKLGYGAPETYYSYSLFPFYPLLIKTFSFLGGELSAGLLISNLCLLFSLLIIYKLFSLDLSRKQAINAIIMLLVFPASFFLGQVYSESLFLLLSVSSVYFARKNSFLLACILAMLASYTRPAGLFLWILLIVEYFTQNQIWSKKSFNFKFLLLLIPPLGALSYLKYIFVNTSNLAFALPSIPDKFVFLHQIFIRYAKMVLFVDHSSSLFWVVSTEALVGTLSLLVIIFSYKKIRFSYWIYLFLSYLIPSFWGNFVGFSRFLIVVFPLFIFLSSWMERQHPFVKYSYFMVSSILLLVNLILFTSGVFVG